jgi:hypothetical protein
MAIHRFVGRVVERGTDTGLASMRVEVHDLARRVQGQIAAALTDAEGDFELTFSDQELARRFGGVAPTFFFQVQDLNRMILVSTEKTLTWRAKDSASGAIEVVSGRRLGMVLNELPYAVFGRVADLHEGSLTGLTVRVYQRALGSGVVTETIRDASSLPASGRFRLNYVPSGVASPDIIVRVESGATELAKATICRAKPVEHVDLLLNGAVNQRYPGKTRYRTLKEKTDAQRGALGLSSLTAAQIDFIACQARLPSVEVDELVKAAQLDASYPVSARHLLRAHPSRTGLHGGRAFPGPAFPRSSRPSRLRAKSERSRRGWSPRRRCRRSPTPCGRRPATPFARRAGRRPAWDRRSI